jgi:hypothetical protein
MLQGCSAVQRGDPLRCARLDGAEKLAEHDSLIDLPDEVIQLYRGLFDKELADWPEQVREPLIEHRLSPAGLRVGFQEARNHAQIHDEMRQAGPLPDMPLIVLTATGIDAFKEAMSVGESEALLRAEIDGKRRLYAAMADSTPRGENRLVDGVGHVTIHWRRPDAVLQAIQDLLSTLVS